MTQFTRKDVEEALDYIRNNVDRVIDGKYVSDIVSALLSDMDAALEALNNIHKTTEDQEASELAFDALKLCAKWRVV